MKKALKIIGIILLVIILIISGFAIWQRDKIKALYVGLKYTPNELQTKIAISEEKLQKSIESFTGIVFRPFTEKEQKQIESGEKTKAEIFEQIMNETLEEYLANAPGAENAAETGNQQQNSDQINTSTYDTIVAKYVSRLYALKGKYLGMLEGLLPQAEAEFSALPPEKRTVSSRSAMISKYIGVAAGYESTCDGEVNSLLSSLTSELKAIGADTSIVNSMREAYYEEKSLKISYYMSQVK